MGSELPVLKLELPMALPNEAQPAADAAARKLYEASSSSVLQITTDKARTGTAFVIEDGSKIVTTARNVLGSTEQFASGPDGKRYKLEIEKLDDLSDLAVLKIKNGQIPGTKALSFGDTRSLSEDDKVFGLSVPKDSNASIPYISPGYLRGVSTPAELLLSVDKKQLSNMAKRLMLSGKEEQIDAQLYMSQPAMESRMHMQAGSSGAPVLNEKGQVIGISMLSNAREPELGQTLVQPAESAANLAAGKGAFEFSYRYKSADWTEEFASNLHNDKLKAAVDTGLIGFAGYLGYRGASRYPMLASCGIAAYGLSSLSTDAGRFLHSTESRDTWKYGLATLADAGTVGGAVLTLAPKLRGYGLALAGVGIAGRAATDFIANRWALDGTRRLVGDPNRAPFSLDKLMGN
ncbi:MAG: serine protease [Candidatus Obscuribacterales bacterium]|nr:serine protease [Candidatus Obscuribacterales bacterium]